MALSDYAKLVEERIQEAMANGEFDNLPGRGKPLDFDAYFATPEDLRMGYGVLKSANVLPEEVQLLKEIATLQTELDRASEDADRAGIRKTLAEKTAHFKVLMEKFHRQKKIG